jgi:hypothetical protein
MLPDGKRSAPDRSSRRIASADFLWAQKQPSQDSQDWIDVLMEFSKPR